MFSPITYFVFILISTSRNAVVNAARVTKIPDVTDYFPDIGTDLSQVTWAHAVNSEMALNRTLKDAKIMMIEADVRMGTTKTNLKRQPVMKHNDESQATVTLEKFVTSVMKSNQKQGIKLDFKDTESFLDSVLTLSDTKMNFPLWINADVVEGPGGAAPSVTLTKEQVVKFPIGVAFSLGWTTGKPNQKIKYSPEMIKKMEDEISILDIGSRNVTFPVRAVSAAESIEALEKLIAVNPKWTLTIWSAPEDTKYVDAAKLKSLILRNKSRVFVDLPKTLIDKMRKAKEDRNENNDAQVKNDGNDAEESESTSGPTESTDYESSTANDESLV